MSASQRTLDHLLLTVIRDNQERVVAWMRDEPGSWGFLAGKAIRSCREEKGESLTNEERRVVWHRMWLLLSELKEESYRQSK